MEEESLLIKILLRILFPFVLIVRIIYDALMGMRLLSIPKIQYDIARIVKNQQNYKKVVKYYKKYLAYIENKINKLEKINQNKESNFYIDLKFKLALVNCELALYIDKCDSNNELKKEYYQKAIDIFLSLPELKNESEEIGKVGAIGKCYMQLYDFKNAIKYYDLAISSTISKNNKHHKNTIGIYYYEKAACLYKLNSSLEDVLALIKLAKKHGYDEITCNEKIQFIQEKLKDTNK